MKIVEEERRVDPDKSHKLPENGIEGAGLQIPSSHLSGIGG